MREFVEKNADLLDDLNGCTKGPIYTARRAKCNPQAITTMP
jgi:hypothetical protein